MSTKIKGTSNVSGAKKVVKKNETSTEAHEQYQVKTKGFVEQYSSLSVAKRNFDAIKRRKIKNEETFKVTLSGKRSGAWEELDFCQIDENYYE